MNNNFELLAQLKKVSSGLPFMSESDYPFEFFLWSGQANEPLTAAKLTKQTGQAKDTPVEVVQLDNFFQVATQEQDWHSPEEIALTQLKNNHSMTDWISSSGRSQEFCS